MKRTYIKPQAVICALAPSQIVADSGLNGSTPDGGNIGGGKSVSEREEETGSPIVQDTREAGWDNFSW